MALFNKKSNPDEKDEKKKKTTLVLKDEASKQSSEKKDDASEKAVEKRVVRASTKRYSVADTILKKPLISEKNFRMSLAAPKYVFEVTRDANKLDIKKAFFNIYGLMPVDVNVIRGGGETAQFGRIRGTAKLWKKAIITLKKGEKLDDF